MNDIERYEVQAEAFRIMTGMMAPGKSESPHAYSGHSEDERYDAWRQWQKAHSKVICAMLEAFARVMA